VEGAFLLTLLLTAASVGGRYRAGEDVGGLVELVADDWAYMPLPPVSPARMSW